MTIATKYLALWWRIVTGVGTLFFPPQCAGCGKVNTWLCDTCVETIPLLEGPLCPRCGRPWEGEGNCPACRAHLPAVRRLRAATLFAEPIRSAIHALKYNGGREVAESVRPLMAKAWAKWAMAGDLLAPVPLHPRREARRGYNQSALLATALGLAVNLPVVPDLLERIRPTRSQTQLGREARRRNVAGAFRVRRPSLVRGRHITLIDDVATTGATLDACAVALLEEGAASVDAFTLARAA